MDPKLSVACTAGIRLHGGWFAACTSQLCVAHTGSHACPLAGRKFCMKRSHYLSLPLQIWTYDPQNNKLRPENVKLGNLQRQFRSLEVDEQDRFAYAGSTSGDVLQVGCCACSQPLQDFPASG